MPGSVQQMPPQLRFHNSRTRIIVPGRMKWPIRKMEELEHQHCGFSDFSSRESLLPALCRVQIRQHPLLPRQRPNRRFKRSSLGRAFRRKTAKTRAPTSRSRKRKPQRHSGILFRTTTTTRTPMETSFTRQHIRTRFRRELRRNATMERTVSASIGRELARIMEAWNSGCTKGFPYFPPVLIVACCLAQSDRIRLHMVFTFPLMLPPSLVFSKSPVLSAT